jgi:tetratricopeptide (TPR) repeat protein
MYLSGSKWNTRATRRRRRGSPWRVAALVVLIGGVVYFERTVVPRTPPLFIPTAVPTRSPATFILEAESLFQAGKLEQAEAAYLQAIEVDPDAVQFYTELARVQVFSGKYDQAVTNASNALLLDPNSAMAHAVLGWALDFQAQAGSSTATSLEALEMLERAIELDPNSPLVRAYYAEVIIDDDVTAFQLAREQAELAVQLDPNLFESQRALGYVWERTSNYELAFEAYQSALRINPNLALIHIALGNMYFTRGETRLAIDSYVRAMTLAPQDIVPLRLIAQAYARDGEFGKASQYALTALSLQPTNPRLHGDLGRMYYKNGDYEAAVRSLTLAIQGGPKDEGAPVEGLPLDPGDALVIDFYSMYGLALARQSQCGVAIEVAQALVTGVPDSEIAAGNAQEILILCGQIEAPPETES